MVLAGRDANLEGEVARVKEELSDAKTKLEGLTNENAIEKQKRLINILTQKVKRTENAVKTVTSRSTAPKRPSSGGSPPLKRTKSTENTQNLASALRQAFKNRGVGGKENVIETQAPSKITTQPPSTATKPNAQRVGTAQKNEGNRPPVTRRDTPETQPVRRKSLRVQPKKIKPLSVRTPVFNIRRFGLIKKIKRLEKHVKNLQSKKRDIRMAQTPNVKRDGVSKNSRSTQKTPPKAGIKSSVRRKINLETDIVQNNPLRTPTKKSIPTPANPLNQKVIYQAAKKEGSKERVNERRERREREGPPRARKSLQPILNQIVAQKNTPPGITKTNLERLFQPFKQPVTVTVAPTISVRGGSAQATGGYVKQMVVGPKTKDTKPKKPNFLRKPESIRRETIAATKRQEIMSRIRTPTEGQRKKHIIQLIDRVLTKMKVPKYIQKNMMAIYTKSLSERQIKTLFAGKSKEEIKTILKKQVETLKKKR
jgi:hypothetical protein